MTTTQAVPVRAVELRAEVRQVRSMADHTYNVILNVPEDCLPQVQIIMAWLGDEIGVVLANVDKNLTGVDGENEKQADERPERPTVRVGRRRS